MVKFISDWAPYGPDEKNSTVLRIDWSHASAHPTLERPIDIAMELYRSLPGPVVVMVSGGVDSQASAYAAKKSGINCRFISFRYNGGLNDYDLLCPFYERHDIAVEVIDVDLLAFHETELLDWGHRYETSTPHILSHMKIASMIDDATVVFSGNPEFPNAKGGLNYETLSLERYAAISGRPVLGYFFNCDPHLFYSFRTCPSYESNTGTYAAKVAVYQEAGFPVEAQEKKLHGFETIKELYDDHPVSLLTKMKYRKRPSQRPYDLLFRHPLFEYRLYQSTRHIFY